MRIRIRPKRLAYILCEESGAMRRALAARGAAETGIGTGTGTGTGTRTGAEGDENENEMAGGPDPENPPLWEVESFDLKPASGAPLGEWDRHHQMDVLDVIRGIETGEMRKPDLVIGFPPCTRLSAVGARWLMDPPEGKELEQIREELEQAVEFFARCWEVKCDRVALENPAMSDMATRKVRLRVPNLHPPYFVHPHFFGDPWFKRTGWFTRGLRKLEPTHYIEPPQVRSAERKEWQRLQRMSERSDRAEQRSKLSHGMAAAAAEAWGK